MQDGIHPVLAHDFPRLLAMQISCIRGLRESYKANEITSWVEYLEREGAIRYGIYNNRMFVNSDGVAGFVSWSQDQPAYSAAIECLYVLPQYQGRGIGKLLLQEAEAHIPHGLTIHVRSTLNARAFYVRNGYKYTGNATSRAGFAIALLEKRL